jgi:glycosyltransferase involved in cell wall biosynthesis
VLVHPYRGEGFGLTVAEALASGTPVIVSAGGACDDFCDDENAWRIPSERAPLAPKAWTPSAAGAWWLEPDREALASAMREAVARPELRERKGAAGRARICTQFTWERAVKAAHQRITVLLERSARPVELTAGAAR